MKRGTQWRWYPLRDRSGSVGSSCMLRGSQFEGRRGRRNEIDILVLQLSLAHCGNPTERSRRTLRSMESETTKLRSTTSSPLLLAFTRSQLALAPTVRATAVLRVRSAAMLPAVLTLDESLSMTPVRPRFELALALELEADTMPRSGAQFVVFDISPLSVSGDSPPPPLLPRPLL